MKDMRSASGKGSTRWHHRRTADPKRLHLCGYAAVRGAASSHQLITHRKGGAFPPCAAAKPRSRWKRGVRPSILRFSPTTEHKQENRFPLVNPHPRPFSQREKGEKLF